MCWTKNKKKFVWVKNLHPQWIIIQDMAQGLWVRTKSQTLSPALNDVSLVGNVSGRCSCRLEFKYSINICYCGALGENAGKADRFTTKIYMYRLTNTRETNWMTEIASCGHSCMPWYTMTLDIALATVYGRISHILNGTQNPLHLSTPQLVRCTLGLYSEVHEVMETLWPKK